MRALHMGTRITLWSAIVVTGSIVLCGGAATWFVQREELKEFDGALMADANGTLRSWQAAATAPFPEPPPERLVEIEDWQGRLLYRSKSTGEDPLPKKQPGCHTFARKDENLRLAVLQQDGLTVRIASDAAPVDELIGELAGAFLLVLPVGVGVVLLGSRWIAREAMKPIRQIAESAEGVTSRRLDRRVPVPVAKDEIHRLATVLNTTFDRLDQSFHQATRFTADASHELKTPLTILRTNVEALLRSPRLDPQDQVAAALLLEQTRRLSSITDNLLLLSRADAGKLVLDLVPADLAGIVALCAEDAAILAEPHGIAIAVDLPPRAAVRADRTRAAQIVMNLLDNAVKYNAPHGRIEVSLKRNGALWLLRIANTSPGIPEGALENLFTRFFRASHTVAADGSGLGLSLARELARAHGGEVALAEDFRPGWTVFQAAFPFAAEDHPDRP